MSRDNQNGCAPSEDSDQPGHPPSLIRIFAVRMKAWALERTAKTLIRLGGHTFYWFCHVVALMVFESGLSALVSEDS